MLKINAVLDEEIMKILLYSYQPQQEFGPQEGSSSPLTAASIIAVAHPTPESTVMEPEGQLVRQAPHSIHFSG